MKRCSKCGEVKPRTTEFFYFRTDRNIWSSKCKDCLRKYQQEYQRPDVDKEKWRILSQPDTYTDEEQRKAVFALMTRLGWTYVVTKRKKGIWYKLPIKNEEGQWKTLSERTT